MAQQVEDPVLSPQQPRLLPGLGTSTCHDHGKKKKKKKKKLIAVNIKSEIKVYINTGARLESQVNLC